MGQINDGLEGALEKFQPDLIEQDGKGDGNEDVQDQLGEGDDQGIHEYLPSVRKAEDEFIVLQSDPFGAEKPFCRNVVLEGHQGTDQRDEYKDEKDDESGKKHEVEHSFLLGQPVFYGCCLFLHKNFLRLGAESSVFLKKGGRRRPSALSGICVTSEWLRSPLR